MKEYEQKICNIIDNLKAEMRYQCDKVNEQAYKQGHKRGYAEGYELGKQDGYEDGQKSKDTLEDVKKAEYNRGLADMLEVVKSMRMWTADDLEEVFGLRSIGDIFVNLSPSKIVSKYHAFKARIKELEDTEIKLGDEVITKYKDHAVAVRDTYYVGEDREPFVLIWFGTHMSSCRVNELSKTGKHYPQIAEILKEMRGAENADVTD